jgi:hypothetical protein
MTGILNILKYPLPSPFTLQSVYNFENNALSSSVAGP